MNAAVSSSVQMNSSTASITSVGMDEASPRSAIRKIGILSLRERTNLISFAAFACFLSSSSVQSTRIAWSAESEITTDIPSSAETASTTSMPRDLQFLHEGARGPAIGGGGGQLVIHDERPQAHPLASACQHFTVSP